MSALERTVSGAVLHSGTCLEIRHFYISYSFHWWQILASHEFCWLNFCVSQLTSCKWFLMDKLTDLMHLSILIATHSFLMKWRKPRCICGRHWTFAVVRFGPVIESAAGGWGARPGMLEWRGRFLAQIIATSHDLGNQKGSLLGSGNGTRLFQGNLGWWSITIWPDGWETFQLSVSQLLPLSSWTRPFRIQECMATKSQLVNYATSLYYGNMKSLFWKACS